MTLQSDSLPDEPTTANTSTSQEMAVDNTVHTERGNAFSAFSHTDFRYYFAGQLVSASGTWMQAVAQQVVVFKMTDSEFALGIVACAQGLPALLLTLFAGVIVERFPRRTLLMITQTVMMITALIMAWLQFTGRLQFWHILGLSFVLGIANALDAPARQTFMIELVGREHLHSGIALNSIMFNTARIIGPALGGWALKLLEPAWCFLLNALSFLAVLVSLYLIHVQANTRPREKIKLLQPLLEGIRFARYHSAIAPLLMFSAIISTFGISCTTIVPAFAKILIGDVATGTAEITTAQGIGTVIAALTATYVANSKIKRGLVMSIIGPIAAISMILMAASPSYQLALLFAGMAIGGFILQFVMTNMLIQSNVPNEYRGRVLSLYTITFFGFTPFASLLIGYLGQVIGVIPTLILFGILCLILLILVQLRYPQVRSLA